MNGANELSFTVAVPTWRRADQLETCLRAIRSQTTLADEVVVAGRDEDDAAQRVAAAYGARWTRVERPGHFAPIQAIAASVTTDLVAIVDDDAVPRSDWLQSFRRLDLAGVACVGGAVAESRDFPRRIPRRPGRMTFYGRLEGGIEFASGPPREVATVMEGNWVWRTEALRSLDFDEAFHDGDGIDYGLDLTLQALSQGWRVILDPAAIVDHKPGERDPSFGRSILQRQYLAGRNRTHIDFRSSTGLKRWLRQAWWIGVGDAHSWGLARFAFAALRRDALLMAKARAAFNGRLAAMRAHRSGQVVAYAPPMDQK